MQKHKPTDHLWKMERIAKDMMAELRVGSYPEAGVTSLQDCRCARSLSVQGLCTKACWPAQAQDLWLCCTNPAKDHQARLLTTYLGDAQGRRCLQTQCPKSAHHLSAQRPAPGPTGA